MPHPLQQQQARGLLISSLLLLSGAQGWAQGVLKATPAETPITNQATLTYTDPLTNQPSVVLSNIARTFVSPVAGLSITPDAGNQPGASSNFALPIDPANDRPALAGAMVAFSYVVTNTGNARDTLQLRVALDGAADIQLANPLIFLDSNQSGTLEAGEPLLAAPLTLEPGARVFVIVTGIVPSTAQNGAGARVDLVGNSALGALDDNNLSQATVAFDAAMTIRKSVTSSDAGLTYRIAGSSIGTRAAQSVAGVIVLDGLRQDGVLLEDALPSGTSLDLSVPVSVALGAIRDYSVIYQTSGTWSTTPSASASRIGLLIRDVNPSNGSSEAVLAVGTAYEFSFAVQLSPSLRGGALVTNSAPLRFASADGLERRLISNAVQNTVAVKRGVGVGPADQPIGPASGQYAALDGLGGRLYSVLRSGDGANASDAQTIANVPGGGRVAFVHTLKNTGNVTDTYTLTVDPASQLGLGSSVAFLALDYASPLTQVQLEPGQSINFIAQITLSVPLTTFSLLIRATGTAGSSDVTRDLALPADRTDVWIGPSGNPQAGEYPDPADRQTLEGFAGQRLRFAQTVQNGSSFADTLSLSLELPLPAGWMVRWLLPDGSPVPDSDRDGLPDLANMAPLEQRDVIAEVSPPRDLVGSSGWEFVVVTRSTYAPQLVNRSLDRVARLKASSLAWSLQKSVTVAVQTAAQGTVQTAAQGATLEYSLRLENISGLELHDVLVGDPLSPLLSAPSAISSGGTFDVATRAVRWTFAKLSPREVVTLNFKATIQPSAADGAVIPNTANVTSLDTPAPLESNRTQVTALGAVLQLEKIALNPAVLIGDSSAFELRVANTSGSLTLEGLRLTDTMPLGLLYRSGSSRLGAQTLPDPQISLVSGAQVLTWTLGQLPAGAVVKLRFSALVTPIAAARIVNSASASATAPLGDGVPVASGAATAAVKIEAGVFTQRGTILGRVYFDAAQNRRYEAGDETLANARIYLSNGQYAITDALGRYSFTNLEPGTYSLRLDPLSAPWIALSVPEDYAHSGSRLVTISDPSPRMVDFPLIAARVSGDKCRSTSLQMGSVSLDKTLTPSGAGYRAALHLTLQSSVANLRLFDPVPSATERTGLSLRDSSGALVAVQIEADGALLLGNLAAGTYTLEYALLTNATILEALTDPSLSWDEALKP